MSACSSTIAMAAALCPPSRNSRWMRSIREWGVGAEVIHSSKVFSPSPSLQEPTRITTPPSRTACLALSRAFWVWYRFKSLGAPPWETMTMSARQSISLR